MVKGSRTASGRSNRSPRPSTRRSRSAPDQTAKDVAMNSEEPFRESDVGGVQSYDLLAGVPDELVGEVAALIGSPGGPGPAGESERWSGSVIEAPPVRGLVDLAARLARLAHRDQVDKAGVSYISHPARVAGRVGTWGGDEIAVVAAWLHDTVEDTWVSLDLLRAMGFPPAVIKAVDAVSKRDGETEEAYVERIAASPSAVMVKRADLADNADPVRLAVLDGSTRERLSEKYARFASLLDSAVSTSGV